MVEIKVRYPHPYLYRFDKVVKLEAIDTLSYVKKELQLKKIATGYIVKNVRVELNLIYQGKYIRFTHIGGTQIDVFVCEGDTPDKLYKKRLSVESCLFFLKQLLVEGRTRDLKEWSTIKDKKFVSEIDDVKIFKGSFFNQLKHLFSVVVGLLLFFHSIYFIDFTADHGVLIFTVVNSLVALYLYPGIILYVNYMFSQNVKGFELHSDHVILFGKEKVKLYRGDIISGRSVSTKFVYRNPWSVYSFYELKTKDGNRYIITSFLDDHSLVFKMFLDKNPDFKFISTYIPFINPFKNS